jgi:transposase
MAWGGVRFPPESPLTPWDQARLGPGRARRWTSGMVALARKLLSALWRCLKTGALPPGAVLKAERAG